MTTLAYFDRQFVPIAKATVSITCNTLHYGTGCFGGLRAHWNESRQQLYAFRLVDHYRRFLDSAKLLMFSFDDTADWDDVKLRGVKVEKP